MLIKNSISSVLSCYVYDDQQPRRQEWKAMLRTCFLYPYEVNSNKTWLPFQGLWLHKVSYYWDTFLMRPISSFTVVWLPCGSTAGPTEAPVRVSTHQEVQNTHHGIHRSCHRSASSFRSWSQTWNWHVCHQAFFWLQNCTLWSKVSLEKQFW